MPDKYQNFAALASAEPTDSYSILIRNVDSPVVVAAPHGGSIEPGTAEIALAIAGNDLSYYLFEGHRVQANRDLHITSSNFDEPKCLALLRTASTVLTVHGEDSETEVVYLGGRHTAALVSIRTVLELYGFTVREHSDPLLQGLSSLNICNIGRIGAGVQLELSRGLRRSFFQSLSRAGRKKPMPRLSQFSALVHDALLEIRL